MIQRSWAMIFLLVLIAVAGSGQMAQSNSVYLINLTDDVEMGLATILERGIREAEEARAEVIILNIDTYGGLVAAATRMRDAIFASSVPTITFVSGRAWSAGALIAMAGETMIMAPGSSIGAAETRPDDEKVISAFRAEFKATAERRGRNPDYAMAMVDKDIEIEDIIEAGKLLTLSAKEAEEYGFSDGTINSLSLLLEEYGFTDKTLVRVEPKMVENFARAVTGPWLSGLLLTLGMVGLFLEIMSPGWGVPGTIGLLSMASFFTGHLLTGASSFSVIILFLAGIVLLAMEVFVVPGFGITGLGGVLAIGTSLFLVFPDTGQALQVIAASLLASLILIVLLWRFIPKTGFWHRISLATSETVEDGYVGFTDRSHLVGKSGEVLTACRPTGTVLIDGERIDAVSEGGWIEKGKYVEVVKVESVRLVVREKDTS